MRLLVFKDGKINMIYSLAVKIHDIYFRVKLAVNNETQEAVAVKIINLERNPQASECVRKEVSCFVRNPVFGVSNPV